MSENKEEPIVLKLIQGGGLTGIQSPEATTGNEKQYINV